MLGKLLIFNLISYNTVFNTNTTTNAKEIKALTRIESENYLYKNVSHYVENHLESFYPCFKIRGNYSMAHSFNLQFIIEAFHNKHAVTDTEIYPSIFLMQNNDTKE